MVDSQMAGVFVSLFRGRSVAFLVCVRYLADSRANKLWAVFHLSVSAAASAEKWKLEAALNCLSYALHRI